MLDELLAEWRIGEFSPLQVLINLLLALTLTLITSYVYRLTHSGFAYSRSFNITLVIVAMVVTMIMMVIGNYLALSLGLVGALSVIRFRSAVKDPKDIAYLFLAVAIGLACSTGDYLIATIGTVVIDATLLVLHGLRFGGSLHTSYSLSFCLPGDDGEIEDVIAEVRKHFSQVVFRSVAQVSDDLNEYIYSVRLKSVSEETATRELRRMFPKVQQLSLIAPETNLEV